ncbi:response regulator [Paramaledivibacter caminithermalis]|uniref:Stage 0 sporulation protein A homolog n=1 Tax=Paramaledivibacter caminithermalis (strain DSM 15212 / CIP 107654 / DViRD3) TaxID=1121301 RepID=A0A1M6K334_PARC5|nr:response regulator transcription factor [Paramaledivibacter caminithermalis]SHJ53242.1 two-component system, OmpR family, alkaline phosphatase synthesis response regulator PhoP [Paramaledivibacter caminithermalis DSM 15212]
MRKRKILVLDDEINIIKLLKMNLELHGFEVEYALTGKEAITLAKTIKPDLMIVDLMLPDTDGFEICRNIRMDNGLRHIPIIILTAKVEETDKVIGLELGADDYVTKPFGVRELIARIKAVLRRVGGKIEMQNGSENIINIYDIEIDLEKYIVHKNNKKIDLTYMEFKLLTIFAQNREKAMSRELLISKLLGEESSTDPRTIDVHIRNLRKKLNSIKPENEYIETIRGMGYRLK